ncbi:hypothetical protein [Streptomyces sp. ODS05-4]|uniref:hypothetical protein n=1 Tax=Streptomyces sp. ODS05-4 TaxID=2944939 RepID=UPI00210B3C2A|nr:hypothetical protein [Streptomyces sp. ODS05-4]
MHFGGVSLMLLRPDYDGLTVRFGTDEECERIGEEHRVAVRSGSLYVLAPLRPDGAGDSYLVSGPMQWHEDEGSFRDPSRFGHMIGTA